MCGISGFIDYKLDYNKELVIQDMVSSLKHRGPDSQNVWKSCDKKIFYWTFKTFDQRFK